MLCLGYEIALIWGVNQGLSVDIESKEGDMILLRAAACIVIFLAIVVWQLVRRGDIKLPWR